MGDSSDDVSGYRSLGDHVEDTKRQTSKGKSDRTKSAVSAAGSDLRSYGDDEARTASQTGQSIRPVAYKRGGKVRKTGLALLHKDERVVPASKRKKTERLMKRSGMSLTNKKRGKKNNPGRSGWRS